MIDRIGYKYLKIIMETFSVTEKLHNDLSLCIKFTKYGGQL
jgi:hypothetical protein